MIFWLSYNVQSTKGTVLRPKQNTQVSSPNALKCLLSMGMQVKHIIKPFTSWNSVPLSFEVLCWNEPRLCCDWIFHRTFSPVQVVGGAEKSSWMRSLLWGNQCKQCYQADCRRKCPSSAERSDLGSPSRWYFRLLDAGLRSFCESRILKRSRTDEHVCVSIHTHLNNFIASSAGLRKEHSTNFPVLFLYLWF